MLYRALMHAGVICVLQPWAQWRMESGGVASSTLTWRGDFAAHGDPRLFLTVRFDDWSKLDTGSDVIDMRLPDAQARGI